MLEPEQIFQQRYQLKEKLAQNAGRQTWLAEDISIQPAETVILKFLSFGEEFQWQDLKLFEREADILKQLSHPRIPKYRDYFSIEDKTNWFALVQEYIPGSSLKQLIESKQRFTEDDLKEITTSILDILDYLHTLNPQIIHRDIKPSNLILGEDKQVYLIDFGAVQDSLITQAETFTVVGSYGYAPMEQFGGRTVPASDLYALGATLIHLATGILPADLPQTKMRIQFQDKVSYSPKFISWIQKITEPDVEERFTTANIALEALSNDSNVNSSLERYKPENSRIQLKKSENSLEIEIPSRGFKYGDIATIILIYICFNITIGIFFENPFLCFNSFVGFFYGIFSIHIANLVLFPNFGKIFITLNPNIFLIKWKLFGLTYQRIGDTSTICNIDKAYTRFRFDSKYLEMISIQTNNKQYNFGAFINDAEKEWLTEEIKDWLRIE